jgi:hypothetical protein
VSEPAAQQVGPHHNRWWKVGIVVACSLFVVLAIVSVITAPGDQGYRPVLGSLAP